jgi:hypothetical protein
MFLAVSSMILFGCSKETETTDVAVDTAADVVVDATDSVAQSPADVTAASDVSPTQSVATDASTQD